MLRQRRTRLVTGSRFIVLARGMLLRRTHELVACNELRSGRGKNIIENVHELLNSRQCQFATNVLLSAVAVILR